MAEKSSTTSEREQSPTAGDQAPERLSGGLEEIKRGPTTGDQEPGGTSDRPEERERSPTPGDPGPGSPSDDGSEEEEQSPTSSPGRTREWSEESDDDGDDAATSPGARLSKLPTNDRLRIAIIEDPKGNEKPRQVGVNEVNPRQYVLDHVFKLNDVPVDNEKFLLKMQERFDRAGVEMPTVEVRYENLTAKGKVHIGSRALPTLINTILDFIDMLLEKVHLSPSSKDDLTILDGLTGILKPGRMTLLLGPPSSGKTTLLCTLAGFKDSTLEVQGKVTYNGYEFHEFEPKKTASYVSQQDLHIPEITVRETMEYSARYQGVGAQYDLIRELLRKEKEQNIQPDPSTDLYMKASVAKDVSHEIVTEYYMKMMGIDICADTIVGDNLRKGISGGQKKRLTTAEMIVGPARVLFMDDISTGLDSTTTYQVVKCIGQFAAITKKTVLMSLLQPAPETYGLFDDVILLSGGTVVYHGPCENVEEFFESCGFRCPERKGIADYLQELVSVKDQEQYWSDKSKPYEFIPAVKFADAFKKFHVGQKISQELETPFDKSTSHKAALACNYWSLPPWDLFKITFEKEYLHIRKNSFITIFVLTQLAFSSIITASLYFRSESDFEDLRDANKLGGALFINLVFVALTSFGEITFTAVRLPTFLKFREMQLYPAWTWSVSAAIFKIPTGFLEAFVFAGIDYYVIGFAPEASRFVRLVLVMTVMVQMSSALFRAVAGVCKTPILASSIGGFALTVLITFCGYIIPRPEIRKWWIWAYWATPLQYATNAVFVNEYLAHRWNNPVPNDIRTVGYRYIRTAGLFPRGYWYWLGLGALLGWAIFYNLLFGVALTYVSPLTRSRAVVSKQLLNDWRKSRTGEGLLPGPDADQSASGSERLQLEGPQSSSTKGSRRGSRTERDADLDDGDNNGPTRQRSRSGSASSGSRSIIRSISLSSEGSTNGSPKRGMVLPFQPYCMTFKDIGYAVDMPQEYKTRGATDDKLHLLKGITGAFRPGVLTALVGVTGAGKSTLMDVLSGRKTRGYEYGEIRINGFPKVQETFSRISGYCEQNDIHSSQITVFESITFSAWLRLQPEINSEMKREFVEEVMDLIELTSLRDALVGKPGQTGLSTEQRKRLTIAVELVANPSIIFMDEPTSGLDARSAATVMRAVRNTVDTGRTVVCTIHQPSIDIFNSFDELLFLKQGGEAIYSGPLGRDSRHLIKFFQSSADVPEIRDGQNPAAWMLDITTSGMEQKLGVDFAEIYRNSSAYQNMNELVDRLSQTAPNAEDISFPNRFPQSSWNQFKICLWKQSWSYWRSPGYNLMRLGLSSSMALCAGTLYFAIGKRLDTTRHIGALLGTIFTAHSMYGTLTCTAVQPLINAERVVFYRERGAGMYSEMPYALAQCVIEVPYILVASVSFILIEYSMMRLPWDAGKLLWCIYFTFMSQLVYSFLGLVMVSLAPNAEGGAILASFAIQLWNLFCGYAPPLPQIPIWWKWFYWCSPLAYTLYGTSVVLLGEIDDVYITTNLGRTMSIKRYMKHIYGYKHSFVGLVAVLAAIQPFIYAFGFVYFIKKLNYQQR